MPVHAAWADNYISLVGVAQSAAVNVVLQKAAQYVGLNPNDIHGYPQEWYGNSIANPATSLLGFQRSYERVLGNSMRFTHKSTDFHFFQEMAICIQFSKSSANWMGVSSNIGSSGPGDSKITRARSNTAASASNDALQVKRKLFKNTAPRPSWFFSYDWAGSIQGRTCCNNRWLTRVFIGINPSNVSCSAGL